MRARVAGLLLLLCGVLLSGAACDTTQEVPDEMSSDFDQMAIAQITSLQSLTLWRVGPSAEGPGREPTESIAVVAAHNNLTWAFSIDGDGRFDGTHLPVSPDASAREAQAAVVRLVEDATGRQVEASWATVNADTWIAKASYAE